MQPGDRVHHKCRDPYCPLYGTVVEIYSDPIFGDACAVVKWDPFKGTEESITEQTPPLHIRQEKLEPVAN